MPKPRYLSRPLLQCSHMLLMLSISTPLCNELNSLKLTSTGLFKYFVAFLNFPLICWGFQQSGKLWKIEIVRLGIMLVVVMRNVMCHPDYVTVVVVCCLIACSLRWSANLSDTGKVVRSFVCSLRALVQPTLDPGAETIYRSSAFAQGDEGNW